MEIRMAEMMRKALEFEELRRLGIGLHVGKWTRRRGYAVSASLYGRPMSHAMFSATQRRRPRTCST